MYNYQKERENIFTEQGQVMFLSIRDKAHELIKKSGAVMLEKLIAGCVGDTWIMLACVDRLVELGEIKEVPQTGVAGQHRVFISPNAKL